MKQHRGRLDFSKAVISLALLGATVSVLAAPLNIEAVVTQADRNFILEGELASDGDKVTK